jgi:beta-glucosidase
LRLSDGPNGIRGTKFFNSVPAACFPCGTALGATFNQDILEEAGKIMGQEAIAKNVHVILGPTINMQRSPLGGRGFESIGEDPFLAGLGASALVRGIQSTGVQATIKHFVCNEQEHRRNAVQSIVTERALREIYCLPFQLVVRDSRPGAFMTAYNGVNGTFCSENSHLLDKILRTEWVWSGLVMSDWCGTYSTTHAIEAGLDLEMPGPSTFRGQVLRASVASGRLWTHIIDNRVCEVLKFVNKCSASGVIEHGPEGTLNTPETAAFLRRIGNESIVLLKNNNVLPLSKTKKTLVIGPNAKVATYCGGGSASLNPYYVVTPFEGITQKLAYQPCYITGCSTHKALPLLGRQLQPQNGRPGMSWRVYNESPNTPHRQPVDDLWLEDTEIYLVDYENPKVGDLWYADLEGTLLAENDGHYDFGLVVCGTANLFVDGQLVVDNSSKQVLGDFFYGCGTREEQGRVYLQKGRSYKIKVEFASAPSYTLTPNNTMVGSGSIRIGGTWVVDDEIEIQKAVELAKELDQVIICGGLNAEWEIEGSDRTSMKLPGLLDRLISEVSAVNPNCVVVMQTGTPVEMPWVDQVPALIQAWYGGNETGNCIADVIFGDYNPSGKLSLSFPKCIQDVPSFLNFRAEGGRTLYGEDIYLGYRYYEFANRDVNFPFGHGLSYTTFEFSDLLVTLENQKIRVTFKVTNTGSIKGAEAAQMYIEPKNMAKVNRPVKELKGFSKVELQPRETQEVVLEELVKYATCYFDEERDQWCVEAGEYDVIINNSSAITEGKALRGSFRVDESFWWSGL